MTKKVLVLGGGGLLGRALGRHVPAGWTADLPSRSELPLEDVDAILRRIERDAVSRVILTAAWTRVDDCEADPDRAFFVNGHLPGRLAAVLARIGVPLTFLSTDYVFDGSASRPYREYDPPGPRGVYARSKWYGECAVRDAAGDYRIVRTSGLYGPGGPDFVSAISARLAQGTVSVVDDQIVAPTRVDDLAPAIWQIAGSCFRGTLHATARGETTWFGFARELARNLGVPESRVEPTTTASLGRPAARPAYSILSGHRLRTELGIELPTWQEGLRRHFHEERARTAPGATPKDVS